MVISFEVIKSSHISLVVWPTLRCILQLPKGTHQWSRFLTPEELVLILQRASISVIFHCPSWAKNVPIFYCMYYILQLGLKLVNFMYFLWSGTRNGRVCIQSTDQGVVSIRWYKCKLHCIRYQGEWVWLVKYICLLIAQPTAGPSPLVQLERMVSCQRGITER